MTTPTKYIQGSDTRVSYVAETTPGVTPASPTMIQLPYVKYDAKFQQTTLDDNSVYADRQEHYVIAGLRKVNGTLSGNLSHTNFSPILASGLSGTWASNVLKVGTSIQTMTFEDWHADVATSFGRVATGCFVDKLAVKLQAAGLSTFDATISGMNMTTETTALAASPTAPVTEVPFNQWSATLKEGGS